MSVRILLLIALFAFTACSTNHVTLGYQGAGASASAQGPAIVQVGTFSDARDVDPHFLGAIRGGFGNPLKTLVTDDPVNEVVRQGFRAGLASRGLLRETTDAPLTLTATIQKFDCSQYVRREAHAIIALKITETASGKTLVNDVFKRDLAINNPNLLDVGAFASTDDLRSVAAQLLHDIIDTSLDSSAVKQALTTARPG